jgi:hypothetical protein
MNRPVLRAALILPVFLYFGYLLVPALSTAPPLLLVLFAIAVASNVTAFIPRWGRTITVAIFAGLAVIGAIGALSLVAPAPAEFLGVAPFAALLLASPFLAIGVLVASPDASPGVMLAEFEGSVLSGILLVAALGTLGVNGLVNAPANLLWAYGQVVGAQSQAWQALLLGQTPAGIPLQSATSIPLIVLSAVALLGTLLAALDPPASIREWAGGVTAPGPAPSPSVASVPATVEEILRSGSRPIVPPFGRSPGLVALIGAAAAAGIILLFALGFPEYLLLAMSLAAVGMLAVAAVLQSSNPRHPRADPRAHPTRRAAPSAPGPRPYERRSSP